MFECHTRIFFFVKKNLLYYIEVCCKINKKYRIQWTLMHSFKLIIVTRSQTGNVSNLEKYSSSFRFCFKQVSLCNAEMYSIGKIFWFFDNPLWTSFSEYVFGYIMLFPIFLEAFFTKWIFPWHFILIVLKKLGRVLLYVIPVFPAPTLFFFTFFYIHKKKVLDSRKFLTSGFR